MFKACYTEEMRAVDKAAFERGGVPGIVLMENAALACVRELKRDFDISKKSVAVFCGKGNNGGDGLAIARHLYNDGADVTVFLVSGNNFNGDALINYEIVKNMGIPMDLVIDSEELEYIIRSNDIVVDAILGTGISGTVRGMAYDVIKIINENAEYILSVDVPSGINSDSGEVCGVCIKADKTVTFAGYKVGMFLYPGADYTGVIVPDMISVPQNIIESEYLQINVTDDEFVRDILGERKNNTQKSDYGKLLIIAGSKGMSGAAYMSSQAAIKSGAGLVTLACPASLNNILEAKTTEVMTYPLEDENGHISAFAIPELLELVNKAGAVLIGPGLGRNKDIDEIVTAVLKHSRVPVIVDADAINSVSKNLDIIKQCGCELIFTPHAMEMSRLSNIDISFIESNRLHISKEFAEEYGAVLLLKGHHTIVTDTSLEQYINITGNPGLASGGSGDVLAGVIASFICRGIPCAKAAAAAAYIHGMAGDMAKKKYGMEFMSASNVIECLSDAFRHILQLDK